MIEELKKMFALMIKGDHDHVDPKEVLKHLLDSTNRPITIGE